MAIFKKQNLKVRDDERTKAAELTLRQSIYPLALVTILFFLWVCHLYSMRHLISEFVPGLLVWTSRHFEQALSKHSRYYKSKVIRPSSGILRVR
jgi:hypothetical protein